MVPLTGAPPSILNSDPIGDHGVAARPASQEDLRSVDEGAGDKGGLGA